MALDNEYLVTRVSDGDSVIVTDAGGEQYGSGGGASTPLGSFRVELMTELFGGPEWGMEVTYVPGEINGDADTGVGNAGPVNSYSDSVNSEFFVVTFVKTVPPSPP